MKWRIFKCAAGCCVLALLAAAILFSEYLVSAAGPAWLRSIALEVRAACRDPGTQWMVFLCAGIYFVTFTVLGNSRKEKAENRNAGGEDGRRSTECGADFSTAKCTNDTKGATEGTGERSTSNFRLSTFNLEPADWFLCGLLLIAVLHYAFNYPTASGSTQALMLIVGAAMGKGARLWVEWGGAARGNIESRTPNIEPRTANDAANLQPATFQQSEGVNELKGLNKLHGEGADAQAADRKSQIVNRKSGEPTPDPSEEGNQKLSTFHLQLLLGCLLLLLALASLWRPEGAMQFQYRGLNRWSGPWDNPNIFGLLMGTGVVLAAGMLVASGRLKGAGSTIWKCWSWRVLLMLAVGCCSVGLLKSYSRGAWLGTAFGLAWLAYQVFRAQVSGAKGGENSEHRTLNVEHRTSTQELLGSEIVNRKSSIVNRLVWRPLSVLLLSLFILSYWQFRHTEFHPVRRAFSVGNQNDFSWRNRVAAWEGALAMMPDKPITGFGWNQPERIYDQFYRPPKVSEGMAIQLNHYFILGMSLGLPALLCFAAYLGFSFTRRETRLETESPKERPIVNRKSEFVNRPNLQLVTFNLQPRSVCHAAAVVLLAGLWFDGGLFSLATGALLWVLLELGRPSPSRARPSRLEHVVCDPTRENDSHAGLPGQALRPGVPRSPEEALSCSSCVSWLPRS